MATSGKTLIISSIITPCTPNPSITTQKTPEDHLSHAFTGFDHLAVPKETTYYSTYNEIHSNQNDILTVFMDITYTPLDTIKPKNARLIVDLYNKDQPKSVNNFKTLLTNVKGYKNTYFFKITGPALIGGDYEHNTGHGGQSIYGEPFREHTKIHKHKFGTLSTLSDVDGDVRSQFFFCLDTREDYDEYYTVIGKVRDECLDALKDIHSVRTRNEKPVWPVKIIECGYYKEEKSDL